MLEHAGHAPPYPPRSIFAAIRCAENIARRWMWEHQERGPEHRRVSFPGEVSMPVEMMPLTTWLGTREYAGVWLHGSGRRYSDREAFGFLGDGRTALLSEAMRIYGRGSRMTRTGAWSASWYRDRFVHWAINLIHFRTQSQAEIVLELSGVNQANSWCGLAGCPYPYVTLFQVAAVPFARLDHDVGRETCGWSREMYHNVRPRWGAFLASRPEPVRLNRDGDDVEEERNGIDEEERSY